jgi:uncharacterized protein (TIGR00369 family)
MPPTAYPGFADRIRDSFSRQRLMATLGARLGRVAPGEVEVELPCRDELSQQHGFVHAGAVASVLDTAAGFAAYSLMPPEAGVLSIEFKVNLLAPARGERIVARGRVVRAGRTISVVAADAYGVQDGRETHVASFTGTMMTVQGRPGVTG